MFTDKEWTILEGLIRRRLMNEEKQRDKRKEFLTPTRLAEYDQRISELVSLFEKVQKYHISPIK